MARPPDDEDSFPVICDRELHSLHRNIPALRRRDVDTATIKQHYYPEGGYFLSLYVYTAAADTGLNLINKYLPRKLVTWYAKISMMRIRKCRRSYIPQFLQKKELDELDIVIGMPPMLFKGVISSADAYE